jgi:hypothetical protein
MNINVILAKPFNAVWIGSLFKIQETVKILFDHNVAEFNRDRTHKIQLLTIPQMLGNITHADFQGMVATDLVARTTSASVNGIKIQWNRVPVVTKRANNNMVLHPSSSADTPDIGALGSFHFHPVPQLHSPGETPSRAFALRSSRTFRPRHKNYRHLVGLYIKGFSLKSTGNFEI